MEYGNFQISIFPSFAIYSIFYFLSYFNSFCVAVAVAPFLLLLPNEQCVYVEKFAIAFSVDHPCYVQRKKLFCANKYVHANNIRKKLNQQLKETFESEKSQFLFFTQCFFMR